MYCESIQQRAHRTINYTNKSYAGTDVPDEENCLLTCFPEVLQNAIVAKTVKSDTVNNSESASNNVTTYDKLWLFSGIEAYGEGTYSNSPIRTNEGELYQRSSELKITTDDYSPLTNYKENGTTNAWWLRSPNRTNIASAYRVMATGGWSFHTANLTDDGIACGFCLP